MGRAAWARRRAHDEERFAQVVDSRAEDDEFSAELAVVAALRGLGDSVETDASRERVTQRLSARPAPLRSPSARRTRKRPGGGALTPVLPVLVALLVLSGLGLALARDALPGEPLYHLKRAHEAVALRLTFDAEDDAVRRLSYASRRLDEVATLGANGTVEPHEYRLALADFTDRATGASSRISTVATRSDGRLLDVLATWAHEEVLRLGALGESTVPTPVHGALAGLLDRIERRAIQLSDRMGCYEITSARSDELGALPATGSCAGPGRVAPRSQDGVRAEGRSDATAATPAAPSPEATGPPSGRMVTEVADSSPTSAVVPSEPVEPSRSPDATDTLPPADIAPPPAAAPPVRAPTRPRLPDSRPAAPPAVSIAPLLPGLPAVTIG